MDEKVEGKVCGKVCGLIGAVAALTIGSMQIAAAQPDPAEILQAQSFAELLRPIPNAMAALSAVEAQPAASGGGERMAQDYDYGYHHHHHHHHHHHYYHHHDYY